MEFYIRSVSKSKEFPNSYLVRWHYVGGDTVALPPFETLVIASSYKYARSKFIRIREREGLVFNPEFSL